MSASVEPQLLDHLLVMKRQWWVILLVATIVGTAVFAWRSATTDVYRADTIVQVILPASVGDDGAITDFRARSYAELASSPQLLSDAATASGLGIDGNDADSLVSLDVLSTPGFIEVTADGPDAESAETLASSVASALVARVEADAALAATDESAEVVTATIVSPADAGSAPVSPHPARTALVAAVVAAIISAEGCVVLWLLRGRLSLADPAGQVERLTGIRTLELAGPDQDLLSPFVAGQLDRGPVLTVLQVGAAPSAAVAILIAKALSAFRQRVLVLDADSGHPVMHLSVGITPASTMRAGAGPRVASLEAGSSEPYRAIVEAHWASPSASPAAARHDLMHELTSTTDADTTLISATSAADPETIFGVVREFPDTVILVLDSTQASKRSVVRRVEALVDGGATITGIVLDTQPQTALSLRGVWNA